MLSIYLEVQDFVDEDETNYEADEINKENSISESSSGHYETKLHN